MISGNSRIIDGVSLWLTRQGNARTWVRQQTFLHAITIDRARPSRLTFVGGCSMFIVARSIVEIVCWQLLLRATPCHPSRHPPLQHWIESVLSLQVFRSFKCFTPRPASENRRNNIWALDKLLKQNVIHSVSSVNTEAHFAVLTNESCWPCPSVSSVCHIGRRPSNEIPLVHSSTN